MTSDEYKRAFGILLRDSKEGRWVGSTNDPFGRYQRGGEKLPRAIRMSESRS